MDLIKKQLDEKNKQRDKINKKLIAISDEKNKKGAEKLEAQELLDFKEIKNAYNKILLEGIKTFENSNDDENLQEKIEQFVKTHPSAEKFNDYERKDKLINELINDINDKVKNKTVTKTEIEYTFKVKKGGQVKFTTATDGGFATGKLETPTKYNNGELILKIPGNYRIIYVLLIIIIFITIIFIKKFIRRK